MAVPCAHAIDGVTQTPSHTIQSVRIRIGFSLFSPLRSAGGFTHGGSPSFFCEAVYNCADFGARMLTSEQENQLRSAVSGDKDSLGDLLECFGPQVEAGLVISPKWRGQLDAADVMQVTYVEAFAHI